MFNKGQLAGLMKQAQAMQDNLKKAQDELAFIEVEGESGAGLVSAVAGLWRKTDRHLRSTKRTVRSSRLRHRRWCPVRPRR